MKPAWRIRVEPAGFEFETDGTLSLMQAARQAGIALPASCRNGTCRTCLCHARGNVRYAIEWPGLSREEKQEGCVLPCVAYPESDIVLTVHAQRLPA